MKNENDTIQKYDFDDFEIEQKPFTMILNNVIQSLTLHPFPLAIWVYLQSLPPAWTLNKAHLMEMFNISERTYHTHMKFLSCSNLILYTRNRNSDGTLGKVSIKVLNGTNFNPRPDLNHTAKFCIVDLNHTAKKPHCGDSTLVANCTLINTIDIKRKDFKEIKCVGNKNPTPHTNKSLKPKTKKELAEQKALEAPEIKELFEIKFSGLDITLEQLFVTCQEHYEQKSLWATKDKFLKWIKTEKIDNYKKIGCTSSNQETKAEKMKRYAKEKEDRNKKMYG